MLDYAKSQGVRIPGGEHMMTLFWGLSELFHPQGNIWQLAVKCWS